MKTLTIVATCFFFGISVSSHALETWWKSLGDVTEGDFRGGYQPDGDKAAGKELEAFLALTEFKEWDTHEDELVKIAYPKHPLLKLQLHGGDKGISVEGGVCSTVDNSYQKAYVLKAGGYTYGVFLVNPAEWLDDGICFCGPMVHHAYQVADGCLTRFSLLPGGAVKKAQKLGGKLRLMAFEWTHLACPREIYETMVERMTLKIKHPKSEAELKQEVVKRYGFAGSAGFLAQGTTLASAEELFQSKPTEAKGHFIWTGVVDDYPSKVEAVFQSGKFSKLTQPIRRTGEPAVKGSLSWISDRLEDAGGRGDADENTLDLTKPERETPPQKKQYSPEEKEEMVLALIAAAEKNTADWWRCLNLMQNMAEEWKTPARRFTDVILKHGDGSSEELALLESAKYDGITAWVEQHLHNEVKGKGKHHREGLAAMMSDGSEKISALLDYLVRRSPKRANTAAETLWGEGKASFAMAVVKNLPGLEKGTAEKLAKNALTKSIDDSLPELLEALMDVLPDLKLTNPEEFLKAIDAFDYPEREGVYLPENHWKDQKEMLRKALRN